MKLFFYFLTVIMNTVVAFAETKQPNIIFMLSDDQHWNETSVQMHLEMVDSKSEEHPTPNLEKLASQGMRFSAAYAPAPVCSPTRASIQTGLSPATLRWCKAGPPVDAVTGNYKLQPPTSRRSLDEEEVTFASYLQRAGYVTAHYGKWHIGGGGPEKKGYDESDGDIGNEASGKYKDRNPVDIVGMTERAKVFIDKAVEKKQPFFIQMSYLALHSPENASQKNMVKFSELYPDKRIRSVQRIALTADLDEGVGVLLDYLEKMKMVDNTYVIYMSDNGANGNGGVGESVLRGSKGSVYEGGIRAVFIVRGPKVPENSWSAERVVGFDLFPTFCRLAGVTEDLPKNLEGGDLSGLFHGGKGQVVRSSAAMLFHFPHYQSAPPMSALYYENYKLMKDYETGKLELFDIDSDLDESDDLALKEPKKLMMMEKMLEGCLSATGTGLPSVNTEYDASKPTESAGKGKKGSRGSRGGGLRNR